MTSHTGMKTCQLCNSLACLALFIQARSASPSQAQPVPALTWGLQPTKATLLSRIWGPPGLVPAHGPARAPGAGVGAGVGACGPRGCAWGPTGVSSRSNGLHGLPPRTSPPTTVAALTSSSTAPRALARHCAATRPWCRRCALMVAPILAPRTAKGLRSRWRDGARQRGTLNPGPQRLVVLAAEVGGRVAPAAQAGGVARRLSRVPRSVPQSTGLSLAQPPVAVTAMPHRRRRVRPIRPPGRLLGRRPPAPAPPPPTRLQLRLRATARLRVPTHPPPTRRPFPTSRPCMVRACKPPLPASTLSWRRMSLSGSQCHC